MNNLLLKKTTELAKKKKKGFTLIELIIVIAIIAILAAVALPKFGEIRENSNVKADIATAKNIQSAVVTAVSNGEVNLGATSVDLTKYLDSGTVPKAKASGQKGSDFTASVGTDGTVTVKAGSVTIFPSPQSPYNLS